MLINEDGTTLAMLEKSAAAGGFLEVVADDHVSATPRDLHHFILTRGAA